jgi:hypothetical protein
MIDRQPRGFLCAAPTRFRWAGALALFCLCAALMACQKKGEDLVDDSVAILADSITVLEQHKDKPQDAVEAFRSFLVHNEARLLTLEREADKIANKLTSEDRRKLKRRFLDAIEPLDARMRALGQVYSAHPDVLKELAKLADKLSVGQEALKQ